MAACGLGGMRPRALIADPINLVSGFRHASNAIHPSSAEPVGRIVRWWSMVEFAVDSSIRDLLNRPDTRNLTTALKIPMKQRFDLLRDLLADVVANPDDMAQLNEMINRLRSLQNYRDFVVHGMMITDSRRPDTHVYMSRVRWSWPTKVRRTYLRKEKLLDIEDKIFRSYMVLFMATAGCHEPGWTPYIDKSQ